MELFSIVVLIYGRKTLSSLPDGTFRNPEGSPFDNDIKFSYRTFIKEKKKIDITVPKDHVIDKKIVKENLEKFKDDDYIAWIGHATFLIKLGKTTIITDPVFSKECRTFNIWSKKICLLFNWKKLMYFYLLIIIMTTRICQPLENFPYKDAKVLLPLKLGKYFKNYKDVNEMDWYDEIQINNDLKITLLPAVHW